MSDPAFSHAIPCCPTVATIRVLVGQWRQEGQTIALVPTMGALHEGHLSLVRQAKQQAKRVVVSIFVNPTQFAPNEDFSSYPRQLQRDLDLLATVGIDAVFTPDAGVMYPAGFSTTISMVGPATVGLEDASRPVFFNGVATVVAKLLIQVAPDLAIFGEKDFQQLAVIKQLVLDLDLPVTVQCSCAIAAGTGPNVFVRDHGIHSPVPDRQSGFSSGVFFQTLSELFRTGPYRVRDESPLTRAEGKFSFG